MPQSSGNILHASDGYSGQVHLNERFFYTAFPAAIPLNDSDLRGEILELGHLQVNIPDVVVRLRL